MASEKSASSRHSNAYNLFILVLTVISLVIMAVMLLPLDDTTIGLLRFYDNFICVIFLIDFFINLRAVSPKSDYFIKERGWLDLLGSIPSLGTAFKFSGLFRLARLSRFFRITRLLRGQGKKELAEDLVKNRREYTAFITILLAIIVLAVASVLVLQFESQSPEASITNGWDAFWYSIVTITTVGYGDFYPITFWGRVTAIFIMIAGVGIIGVLASILSSFLMGEPTISTENESPDTTSVEGKITAIKNELVILRQLMEELTRADERRQHE
jgi:voltage-gated potassium channel